MKITDIKKGDTFYENDLHTSIEMRALEEVKLTPVEGFPEDDKYSVKVLTSMGEIEIAVNKDFVDSVYALDLSREPAYQNVLRIK